MSIIKFIFSKTFVKQVIYAVIFITLLLTAVWFYLYFFTRHNNRVTVPNIKGMTELEAKETLGNKNLEYAIIDSIWSASNVGGTILEQIPEPGFEVKEGREIYLKVYRKNPDAKKINIKEGDDSNVAQIKLENAGLNYELKFEQNRLLANRVIRIMFGDKELKPDSKVKPGQKITLVIGEKGYSMVNIPDLSGLTLSEATKKLHENNLSLGLPFYDEVVITRQDTLDAKIYQQSKTPGEQLKSGSSLDVWLSTVKL